jgi:hypothetical protein
MGHEVQTTGSAEDRGGAGLAGRLLIGGAVICIVAAGLLLWAAHGPVVFNDMVVAALALCF